MSTLTQSPTLYADAGVAFRDIFSNGKLGGRQGLVKYLESRQSQLTRQLSDDTLDDVARSSLLLAVTAMREAINLIDLLSKKPS